MAGLLDWITGAVKQQYAQGAPYREAIGGLLQGDPTKFGLLAQEFNRKAQTPEGALDVALNFAPLGITAFHGSPAVFEKFDPEKIGTGTGVQAYGKGFYFSENPQVAQEYQKNLSGYQPGTMAFLKQHGDIDSAIKKATDSVTHYTNMIKNGGMGLDLNRAESMLEISQKKLNDLKSIKMGLPENKGAFYKVDIKDEILPNMVEWEKPFSQQPKVVQNAFKKLQEEDPYLPIKGLIKDDAVGGALMQTLPLEQTNKMLSAKGVTGVKYLDKGQDNYNNLTSQNYVVFDPNTIKILERNGLLVP